MGREEFPGSPPVVLHVAAVQFTAVKLLLPQLAALADSGYDVRLACAPGPTGFAPEIGRFAPVPVAFPRRLRPAEVARAALDLRGCVRSLRPAVLHLHTPAAALPARLLPAGWLGPSTRVVYTVHGFAHDWSFPRRRDRVLERLERLLAARTDLLLFQSAEDFQEAQARRYPARLRLLGNGVDDCWFSVPPPRPERGRLRVLYVGRLVRGKGVLDLVGAVLAAPGTSLRLAGAQLDSDRDGVESEVRRLAAGAGAGRVTPLGMLGRAELLRELEACDVVALPSYREGVPRSVIEALAAGRPVVGTRIRGTRELVRDGENGHLVPPGDVPGLAAALARLRDCPPEALAAMSERSRAAVHDRREALVIDRLRAAYAELGVLPGTVTPPPGGSRGRGAQGAERACRCGAGDRRPA